MWRFLFYSGKLLSRKRKWYLREHTVKPINIITPQKPKNNSTDENTEQKQNKYRDRALNLYEALMTEIIEPKGFLMEKLYNI